MSLRESQSAALGIVGLIRKSLITKVILKQKSWEPPKINFTENLLIQLLYSNCVPKLTYGAAVKDLTAGEKHQYNVAVNNAVRRIFKFRYWQSIRQLREFYGFDSIETIFSKARNQFLISIANHDNGILRFVYKLDVELTAD